MVWGEYTTLGKRGFYIENLYLWRRRLDMPDCGQIAEAVRQIKTVVFRVANPYYPIVFIRGHGHGDEQFTQIVFGGVKLEDRGAGFDFPRRGDIVIFRISG